MKIQLATLNLNNLLRLSKAYWGYDKQFMDKFMAKFAITESYLTKADIFLALENDKMIGIYSFSKNDDGDLELDNFFLHPDHIGMGKGKELWNLCLQTAKKYDAKEFVVWSDPNAENFYLKMGCKKISERLSPLMPNRYLPVLKYMVI